MTEAAQARSGGTNGISRHAFHALLMPVPVVATIQLGVTSATLSEPTLVLETMAEKAVRRTLDRWVFQPLRCEATPKPVGMTIVPTGTH